MTSGLEQRIRDRSARIAVVGMGYVGLPLIVEFARAGFHVHGIDVSTEKVASINAGISYVKDVASESLAPFVAEKRVIATEDFSVIRDCDAISICVPTPLGKTKDPDMSFVVSATDAVRNNLRGDQLVVLESTTYPGTTTEIIQPALERGGWTVGTDIFLAFSPERVDPGNETYLVKNTPKVVGGVTPRCTELASVLYSTTVERVVPVSSAAAAEMVKLLENTFRSINIGLVNEIAIMCNKLDLDVWEIVDAAATKPFGFMPFYPGPGLGGHCIPIDPLYLSWKLRTLDYRARFVELAGEINSEMPNFVVSRLTDALNDRQKSVNGSKVLVLGVAYKRDIDDVRESPALDIIRLLELKGAVVTYSDSNVPSLKFDDETMTSVPLDAPMLAAQDCVVIATDHTDVDYEMVVDHAPLVFDARNATRKWHGRPNVVRL